MVIIQYYQQQTDIIWYKSSARRTQKRWKRRK